MRIEIRRPRFRSLSIGIGALILSSAAWAQDVPPELSGPLTLEDLVRIAVQRNLGFAQAEQQVESSEGRYKSSRSGLFPTASASIGVSRSISQSSEQSQIINGTVIPPVDTLFVDVNRSMSVDGGVPLIDVPTWLSVKSSKHSLEASRHQLDRARQQLKNDVAQMYFELVRAQQLTTVNDEAYQLATDQLRRAQSLFELGSVARGDVLQAQVNLASADRDRISARNQVEIQRARLALALAIPVDTPVQIAEPAPLPTELPDRELDLVEEAVSTRPELDQGRATVAAAASSANAAKWRRYPTLGANYSWGKSAEAVPDLFKDLNKDINYRVSVGLQWQIFDGFNTKGSIEQATAARKIEERALEQQRLQVALDVRESLIAIRNASEKIRSAEEGVRLAEESAKLQQALYESGGGTLLEWNNAQVELTRARVSLVDAQVDLHLALAGLELALGR